MEKMEKHHFQVNLAGIIEILSSHLYSEEKVFIRELLQNAVDAIRARKTLGHDFKEEINIEIIADGSGSAPRIVIDDNGIGLNEEEVQLFLATVGASSKRDSIAGRRQEFIGQFGIGILSCFMVTDEITLVTRTAGDGQAIEWHGKGDGSYSMKTLDNNLKPGCIVFLSLKSGKEDYNNPDVIREIVQYYGNYLPCPVNLIINGESERLNRGIFPWEKFYHSRIEEKNAGSAFGKEYFQTDFIDCFKLVTRDGNTEGLAFVLPYTQNPSAKQGHEIYLKNMLVSDSATNILPDWSFFVKCIINSKNMKPMASREALYEDENLKMVREELGECLKSYLIELARENPDTLNTIISIHYDTMVLIALHDDKFFKITINQLPFVTNVGRLTLPQFEELASVIRHVPNVDEYRKINGIAALKRIPLINSGYHHAEELLDKFADLFPEKKVEKANADQILQFFEALSLEERGEAFEFIRIADVVLQNYKCSAEIRKFEPESVIALYSPSEEFKLWRAAEDAKEHTDQLWSNIIDSVINSVDESSYARLYFNYNNSLVMNLMQIKDKSLLDIFIKIIYVLSLLMGHHPLQTVEIDLLSKSLENLINKHIG